MQLASNAILNAIWDLWAKVEGKPLWRLVAEMSPEQLVGVVDFRYITDELTPEQALAMLKEQEKTKKERLELALQNKVGQQHWLPRESTLTLLGGAGLQYECGLAGSFGRRG